MGSRCATGNNNSIQIIFFYFFFYFFLSIPGTSIQIIFSINYIWQSLCIFNNTWNIDKTAGTNIIGGPFLGGNFWSDYAGEDTTGDGLGDTLIPHTCGGNIKGGGDSLPLVSARGFSLRYFTMATVVELLI